MRTEEINIYKYEELSDSAKQKAREWFLSGSEYHWVIVRSLDIAWMMI